MNVLSYTAPNRGIRLLGYAGQRSPPHKAKTTIAWFERGTDSSSCVARLIAGLESDRKHLVEDERTHPCTWRTVSGFGLRCVQAIGLFFAAAGDGIFRVYPDRMARLL